MPVQKSLKLWFFVHFVIDMIFGIPLMIAPVKILTWIGWTSVDPFTARLVAAALLAIGIESLLSRNAPIQAFKSLLSLKIIWATTAIVGILISITTTPEYPKVAWAFIGSFLFFDIVWIYWQIKLKKI